MPRTKKAAPSKIRLISQLLSVLLLLVSSLGSRPLIAQGEGVGHPAPNFSRLDLNHKKIELAAYRGKVVLLNFWATWCAPCLTEMPVFTDWQKQYGPKGLQVIGISMDDAASEVVATASKLKLNYPILMGDEHIGADYGGILGLPVTFLIGRDGKTFKRYQGADLTRMKDDIETLLNSR